MWLKKSCVLRPAGAYDQAYGRDSRRDAVNEKRMCEGLQQMAIGFAEQ
jgi:hypothetical protein